MADMDNTATHAAEHADYISKDGSCLQCRVTTRADALRAARRRLEAVQIDVTEAERALAIARERLSEHTKPTTSYEVTMHVHSMDVGLLCPQCRQSTVTRRTGEIQTLVGPRTGRIDTCSACRTTTINAQG